MSSAKPVRLGVRISPTAALALMICVAVSCGGSSDTTATGTGTANASVVSWQATRSDELSTADEQQISVALGNALDLTSNTKFAIIDAQSDGDWVVISAAELDQTGDELVPGEPLPAVAKKSSSGWTVTAENSADFCGILQQVPDSLWDSVDKGYFGC